MKTKTTIIILALLGSCLATACILVWHNHQLVVARAAWTKLPKAIEAYRLDVGHYPGSLDDLRVNSGMKGWRGPYADLTYSFVDEYGTPLCYKNPPWPYEIRSAGRDGVMGTDDDVVISGREQRAAGSSR
jgi:general secretion pathway protein G